MMEEEDKENLSAKICPRKLNFNAPLLSTKRLGLSNGAQMLSNNDSGTKENAVSERIPFSWEEAAGKAKYKERDEKHDGEDTPRLRLPPALWHKEMIRQGDDEDDDDVLTDAVDVFSLSEALDMMQKSDEAEDFDGLIAKLSESRGGHSPSYLIKRFLPDATVIASASSCSRVAGNFGKQIGHGCSHPEACHPSSGTSPPGCGLELLSPWRIKHKLCGAGNPVEPGSPSLRKLHCSRISKNTKRHGSSACKNFNDVKRQT